MRHLPPSFLTLSATLAGAALALSAAAPAMAQDGAQPDEQAVPGEATVDEAANEIIVFARSLRGQVDAPEPPLLELGPEEIAGYGAGSIDELLELLSPQVTSGSGRGDGRPVILVNGVRIASFRELRSYPPEAIEKVEVFPEQVAQRYGYSADQRVVNIILKANYSSREIEAEYGQPWAGGFSTQQVEATYLRIDGPSRFNFNLQWENSSILTEAERGVLQAAGSVSAVPGDPNPADYRSLVNDSAGLEATANWTTQLGTAGTTLSLNGTVEREDSLSLNGLDTITLTNPAGTSALRVFGADDPLTVDRRTTTYSVASALNTNIADWQVSGTVDASRADGSTLIARRQANEDAPTYLAFQSAARAGNLPLDADLGTLPDIGLDRADSTTDTLSSKVTANGRPLLLPAGELSVTLDGGYDWSRITSEDTRSDVGGVRLTRGNANAGINLSVPLTSVRDDFLSEVGSLTLNLSAGVDHLSDFGTLTDWSAGLTWGVTDTLTFTATHVGREAAPTLAQLGNPVVEAPNVSVFDFNTGDTVLATVITGGNAALPEQKQSDWSFGVNWQLPFLERSSIQLNYNKNHSTDVSDSFPELTPAIEAAFPGRVTRAEDGRLLSIDQRPVTLAEQDVSSIRLGINLSGPFGSGYSEAEQAARTARDPVRSALRPAGGGAPARSGQSGRQGGVPGGFGATMTPEQREQMAAFRQTFCSSDPAVSGAADLSILPERLQQRLRGDDGQIAPERLQMFRERFCSREAPFGRPSGEGGASSTTNQAEGGAPPGDAAQPRAATGSRGGPDGGRRAGGGAGGGRGPGGGFPGAGGGDGRGRWFTNLTYNYRIEDKVLIAEGGPLLDRLNGDARTPRHRADLRGGIIYRGIGGFVEAEYTGSSTLNGGRGADGTDLRFNDLATIGIRTFVDLNQRPGLTDRVPLLENVRISFDVDNIFDARQRVTDDADEVPIRYQPFLQDPVGRRFEIELRKLF